MGLAHVGAPKGTLPDYIPGMPASAEEPATPVEEGSVALLSAASMAVEEPDGVAVPVDVLAVEFAMAGQVRKQAFVALTAGKNVLAEGGLDNCDRELPPGLAALAAVVAGAGWDCSNMRRSDHC